LKLASLRVVAQSIPGLAKIQAIYGRVLGIKLNSSGDREQFVAAEEAMLGE